MSNIGIQKKGTVQKKILQKLHTQNQSNPAFGARRGFSTASPTPQSFPLTTLCLQYSTSARFPL